MVHGERHLAVSPPVALAAAARVAGWRVSHAGAVATGPAGAQRVHAHLAQGALFGHVTRGAPVQRGDSGVEQRPETVGESCRMKRSVGFKDMLFEGYKVLTDREIN